MLQLKSILIIQNILVKKQKMIHQEMIEEKNLTLRRERIDLKTEADLRLLNLKNLEKIEIKK